MTPASPAGDGASEVSARTSDAAVDWDSLRMTDECWADEECHRNEAGYHDVHAFSAGGAWVVVVNGGHRIFQDEANARRYCAGYLGVPEGTDAR
jgi:hypothetical protein